jgi:two-component sensor histidine kinase
MVAVTLEDRVRERTATIERLLSEMNHRVKNSLQTISSLLHMHGRIVKDPSVRMELHEARNRVQTVARVHERIHRAEGTPTVRFDELLQRLCDDLSPTLVTVKGAPIGFTVTADPIEVPVDKAEPIALMVSEMVGNAVKHGFAEDGDGHIWVRLARLDGERAELSVADNGRGFPPDFSPHATSGLGMQLMLGFANQIGGKLGCGARAEGRGARCSITFPIHAPRAAEP